MRTGAVWQREIGQVVGGAQESSIAEEPAKPWQEYPSADEIKETESQVVFIRQIISEHPVRSTS
jgi:hypothetical protein